MSGHETIESLIQRVSALDAPSTYADRQLDIDPDLVRFIRTMERITPPGTPKQLLPAIPAEVADGVTDRSELLIRLEKKAPEIVSDPLPPSTQYWISTGRPTHLSPRSEKLDRTHFIGPEAIPKDSYSTKPFNFGLYSCTGALGTFGMWWCFLNLNRGSTLFPPPWRVWSFRIGPDAGVLEIRSASDWVDFVVSDPVRQGSFLYPNWRRAASHWDGVHMSVKAVVATQGICLSTGGAVIAPTYWDVESTLWFRWIFRGVEPLDYELSLRG
jgi:hypothetical protein